METSALESTNVESAFLEVLTGEFTLKHGIYIYHGVKTGLYLQFKDFVSL